MKDENLYLPFASSIWDTLSSMSEILFSPAGEFYENRGDLNSLGAAVFIGFAGRRKGRLCLDMGKETALRLAEKITGEQLGGVQDPMVAAALSEIGNITAGDAVTAINNEFSYGLRLTPPVVFTGDGMVVGMQNLDSYTMEFDSELDRLKINVAFERG